MKKLFLSLFLLCAPACTFGQGGNIGSNSTVVANNLGQPIPGANITICQPLATTAASVTSNLAVLTMASNPVTAGFVSGQTIWVSGFTGGDTYFNGGAFTNGTGITGGFTILSVTSSTITYALAHANASASSNGTVLQEGNSSIGCGGLASVFSDTADTQAITQPLSSDAFGNWNAFAASGVYYTQFYGPGINTTFRSYAVGCVPGSPTGTCGAYLGNNNAWTGNETHSGTETFDNLNGSIVVDGSAAYPKTQAGLVAAIAAATSAGTCVVIPPATTISITSAVTWDSSNACLFGSGPTSVLASSGSSSYNVLTFAGAGAGSSANLNSNSNEGSNTVALVAGSVSSLGLAVGNYILISDSQTTPVEEVTRITNIASDTLTTADMMYESFTTGNSAKVQKLTMLDGVRIGNFKLDLTGNSGATSEGLELDYAVNSEISDIVVQGAQTGAFGVQINTGYKNQFRNIKLNKVGTSSNYADFNAWTTTDSTFRDILSSESGCFGPEFAWVNGSQFIGLTSIKANYRGFVTRRASWNNMSHFTVVDASVALAGTYTGIHYEFGSRRNNLENFIANNDGLDGLAFDPTSINNTAVNGTVTFSTTDVLFDVGTTNNTVVNTSYTSVADNSGNATNTISLPGTLPREVSCGGTSTCGNVDIVKTRIVNGRVSLSSGTVTITGIQGFTSTGTYFCTGTDSTALNPVEIQPVSASSITITGTGSDAIYYICSGN